MSVTPSWPTPLKPTTRTLGWLEHRPGRSLCIVTEHGEIVYLESYAALQRNLFEKNLILYTLDLGAQVWITEAFCDPQADISLTRGSVIPSIRFTEPSKRDPAKRGRRARWIVDAGLTWGYGDGVPGEEPTRNDAPLQLFRATEFLAHLRELFDAAGVGDFPTPASFGNATATHLYKGKRLYRPNWKAWTVFKRNLVGGRVDTIRPKEEFEELYELDINMAYGAAMKETPGGTTSHFTGSKAPACYATYYAKCRVQAPAGYPLNIGLLECRTESGVSYPRSGSWGGWYWAEQINAARSLGYIVEIERGWGFPRKSEAFVPWAEHMDSLRKSLSPAAGKLVKMSVVAFIGRFAVDESRYTLQQKGKPSEFACDPGDPLLTYYKVKQRVDHGSMQPHINSYVQMQTRMMLFLKAIFEETALVATNYDAVYTTRKPTTDPSLELGEWKIKKLTHASVPNARWIVAAEKIATPGVTRQKRSAFEMRGPVYWNPKTTKKGKPLSLSKPQAAMPNAP